MALPPLWSDRSATGDLLGQGFSWGGKDQLYGVLDRLLKHRDGLFQHLRNRWQDLFGLKLEVLLPKSARKDRRFVFLGDFAGLADPSSGF